jgi:hydrogenase small subunit
MSVLPLPKEIPAVWLQGAACTGCSVSVLNSVSPTIKNVLVDEVVPGKHVNLRFHPNVMAGQGEPVLEVLEGTAKENPKEFLLIVEGSIPTKENGSYAAIGEKGEKPISLADWTESLAKEAMAVIAMGTCASFGGIPAASPNPTG